MPQPATTRQITIEPIIKYPRVAQVGQTYLLTIDLRPQLATPNEWPYEEEEYALHCILDTLPLFSHEPVGEPVVVVHRFGGSYGPASFLLTAAEEEMTGRIRVTLVNEWGLPVDVIDLINVQVIKEKDSKRLVLDHVIQLSNPPKAKPLSDLQIDYLHNYIHQLSILPLSVLGGEESAAKEITLSDVYVALDTRSRVPFKTEKEARQHDFYRVAKRALTALEAATRYNKLVLLGDLGSGKSTFVHQLAVRLAGVRLGEYEPLPGWQISWPLLVQVRDLAPRLANISIHNGELTSFQEHQLVNAILSQWQADITRLSGGDELAKALPDLLATEQVTLIFDGLDEIPYSVFPHIRLAIQSVLRAYQNIGRVIVTCRIRSYSGSAMLPDFVAHTLTPFDDDKISAFVTAWYNVQSNLGRLTPEQAEARARDLRNAVLSDQLRELAKNPMLLTTMALIHQRETRLPKERVKLYKLAVEVLLRRWQQQKGLKPSERLAAVLGDELKLTRILQYLAYEMHRQEAQGHNRELARTAILGWLEKPAYLGDVGLVDEFLEYVDQRAGLLVGRGGVAGEKPAVYDFPHRTFQEYLAGCQMIEGRSAKREYRTRANEGDFWYLAGQLGAEELYFNRKNPVALLDLAYALCPVAEPQQAGEWRQALWSGQMALILGRAEIEADTEDRDNGPAYLARLLPRLVTLMTAAKLPPIERAEAGETLARLGDPRPEVMTVDSMQFCHIPPGPFWMGSGDDDEFAYDDEKPQHEVNLEYGYWLARYPVTVAQWQEFVQESGHEPENKDSLRDPANRPVRYVTWYEAVKFCEWLTERMTNDELRMTNGLPQSKMKVRLPSEAEWEKAARGGLEISEKPVISLLPELDLTGLTNLSGLVENPHPRRRYPWGDKVDSNRANYDDTGIGTTSAVGCFPGGASPYGVEEMSGSIWEWTATKWQDNYKDYRNDNAITETNDFRVLRGGAFFSEAKGIRCAVRLRNGPVDRIINLGFRVCISPIL